MKRPQKDVVSVPDAFRPLFEKAQQSMASFFEDLSWDPERGEIKIGGLRYMLVRTESMSTEFQAQLREDFGAIRAAQIAYRLGRACGMRDAETFHQRFEVTDADEKLSLGPVHFAYTGWAFVDIFPESKPSRDEEYFLVYDHPYSFEAATYLDRGIKTNHPVCHMNAGYSSGWCQVSYGVELKAEEITCRAKGDPKCIFVMAHPGKFDEKAAAFREARGL